MLCVWRVFAAHQFEFRLGRGFRQHLAPDSWQLLSCIVGPVVEGSLLDRGGIDRRVPSVSCCPVCLRDAPHLRAKVVTTPAGRPMNYRKLRIAWSVFWGMATVLLVVLWVRSYWRYDQLICTLHKTPPEIVEIVVTGAPPENQVWQFGWNTNMNSWKGRIEFWLEEKELNYALVWDLPGFMSDYEPPLAPHRLWASRWQWNDYLEGFVCVPHWFVSAVAASLAALPWIPFRHFSLRTLLIATTLVAAVLGLIVWASR